MTNNLVKKIAQGTALFTGLVIGAAGFGGCKGAATALYKDNPIGEIHFALKEAGAPKIYTNNQGNQQSNNNEINNNEIYNEDRQLLNQIALIPRVVCRGDLDNDGMLDWYYYDGKGWRYAAMVTFIDYRGIHSIKKDKIYNKEKCIYFPGDGKPPIHLPEDILIIWPQKYK